MFHDDPGPSPSPGLAPWVYGLGIRLADLEAAERRARDLGRRPSWRAGLLLTALPIALALALIALLALVLGAR